MAELSVLRLALNQPKDDNYLHLIHGFTKASTPQITRAGSVGLSILRALAAPLTGSRAGLSNPI